MGKGLGSIVGSVVGGVAGSFVGQPMAGASVGGMLGGSLDGDSEAQKDKSRQQSYMNAATAQVGQNINIANKLDEYLMKNSEKGLEYAQGMMDQWETAFGSIEKNLSDYYNNLDPTKFSQEFKTKYSQELDKTMKQYNETMTQRGLQTSGSRAQAEKEAMFNKAAANASIDINAPEQVAQMQQSWYKQGQPMQQQANLANINAINNQAAMAKTGANAKINANTDYAKALQGKSDFFGGRSSSQDTSGGAAGMVSSLIGAPMKSWGGSGSTTSSLGGNISNYLGMVM